MKAMEFFKVIEKGDTQKVKDFLDEGGALEMSVSGYSPLHWSAIHNQPDVAQMLLDAGAWVDGMDAYGHTALHHAKSPTVGQILIDAGADVNAITVDLNGGVDEFTPLHRHARNADMVRFLIDAGADVNAQNSVGKTPLHEATELMHGMWFKSSDASVKALLAGNPDLSLTDYSGMTALDKAVEAHTFHTDANAEYRETSMAIIQSLVNAGAEVTPTHTWNSYVGEYMQEQLDLQYRAQQAQEEKQHLMDAVGDYLMPDEKHGSAHQEEGQKQRRKM